MNNSTILFSSFQTQTTIKYFQTVEKEKPLIIERSLSVKKKKKTCKKEENKRVEPPPLPFFFLFPASSFHYRANVYPGNRGWIRSDARRKKHQRGDRAGRHLAGFPPQQLLTRIGNREHRHNCIYASVVSGTYQLFRAAVEYQRTGVLVIAVSARG